MYQLPNRKCFVWLSCLGGSVVHLELLDKEMEGAPAKGRKYVW